METSLWYLAFEIFYFWSFKGSVEEADEPSFSFFHGIAVNYKTSNT